MANWNDDKAGTAPGVAPESISRAQAILVVFIAACLIFAAMAACGGIR